MMIEQKEFNMNNSVKVKLSGLGRAELKKQHTGHTEYVEKSVDSDGFSTFQMHDLMNTFGHMMVMGCEMPFEHLTIRIASVLLKTVE